MPMPKSQIKINKDGVQLINNVDQAMYSISELTRAALKDTGKFLRTEAKKRVPVDTGNLRKNIATWVRKDKDGKMYLQLGFYTRSQAKKKGLKDPFYGMFQEFGAKQMGKRPFLKPAAMENIEVIRKIQAQYLSALNDDVRILEKKIDEREEESND